MNSRKLHRIRDWGRLYNTGTRLENLLFHFFLARCMDDLKKESEYYNLIHEELDNLELLRYGIDGMEIKQINKWTKPYGQFGMIDAAHDIVSRYATKLSLQRIANFCKNERPNLQYCTSHIVTVHNNSKLYGDTSSKRVKRHKNKIVNRDRKS